MIMNFISIDLRIYFISLHCGGCKTVSLQILWLVSLILKDILVWESPHLSHQAIVHWVNNRYDPFVWESFTTYFVVRESSWPTVNLQISRITWFHAYLFVVACTTHFYCFWLLFCTGTVRNLDSAISTSRDLCLLINGTSRKIVNKHVKCWNKWSDK